MMSMKSLGIKALLALAAIAIPAVVVTAILGMTFVRTVKVVEADVDLAMSTARQIAEIRVMIERNMGWSPAFRPSLIRPRSMPTPPR